MGILLMLYFRLEILAELVYVVSKNYFKHARVIKYFDIMSVALSEGVNVTLLYVIND